MKPGSSSVNSKPVRPLSLFQSRVGILLVLSLLVFPCLLPSCSQENKEFVPSFGKRDTVPGMYTDSVTTLISDSGRIRYRVLTPVWKIFDKANEPYWFFPKRIHMERFDDSLRVESVVECDTARFYMRKHLWELKGNVLIVNLAGETFETSILYWDQREGRIYSDSFIRIEQKNVILTGVGFESNQTMTRYTIKKPNGPLYLDEAGANSK